MVSVYLSTLINSVLQHCGAPVHSCEHLLHIFVDNFQKKLEERKKLPSLSGIYSTLLYRC